jgi:Ca2+-binding EF-hand superfamily protein
MKQIIPASCVLLGMSSAVIHAQVPATTLDKPDSGQSELHRQVTEKLGEEFERNDQDDDGFMSLDEWKMAIAGDADFNTVEEQTFDKADTSRDGKLSKQESIDWMIDTLDCIDDNHDGNPTREELRRNGKRCMTAAGFSSNRDYQAEF